MCRFVAAVPDILGLVWLRFRPKSESKSKISGRVLTSFRGTFAQPSLLPLQRARIPETSLCSVSGAACKSTLKSVFLKGIGPQSIDIGLCWFVGTARAFVARLRPVCRLGPLIDDVRPYP